MTLRRLALLLFSAVLVVTGLPARAWASTFEVSPVRLSLSASASSGLLTLANQSAEPLRFQISAFAWSESPTGEMILAPTEDLVVFPTLLSLAPGTSRKIRVGAAAAFGPREKSYRLFVEELPPLAAQATPPGQVRVLTRMGLPIFLEAARQAPTPRIDSIAEHAGKLTFVVRNTGSAHFKARRIHVRAEDGTRRVFEQDIAGWYVLAGGLRRYVVDLPSAACSAKHLVIGVDTEHTSIEAAIDRPSGSCVP